jgi:hypothetical protein
MKTALRRIGMAAWWFGTICLAGALILGCTDLFAAPGGKPSYWTAVVGALPLTLICWTISYVLAGSFWTPPRMK